MRCGRTVQTIRAVSVGHIVTKVTNQLSFLEVVSNAVNASATVIYVANSGQEFLNDGELIARRTQEIDWLSCLNRGPLSTITKIDSRMTLHCSKLFVDGPIYGHYIIKKERT